METKQIRHQQIRHQGEVAKIEGRKITVSFLSQGGCGSCQARGKCGMVESDKREVEVYSVEADMFVVGDKVVVSATMSMGRMAVMLAYVVPLLLLIILMCGGAMLNLADWVVALMGLGGVALYYIGLYLVKDKFEREINFTITK
ncbi:MAG: SoxR reducing system RseC family protein [Rikenellaceae bacterium]